MRRWNHPMRTFILWAAAVVVCAGVVTPTLADPMQIVPAESLFCVRLNNVDRVLGKVDQFLAGIAPISVSMLARSQLGQLLGGIEAQGIDMAGDIAVFGPLPGGTTPDPTRIGVLVRVSDYQKLVEGNPNVAAPDAQGISAIGPEGEQSLAAIKVGDYALISSLNNRQALGEAKNWIAGAGTTPLAKRLSPETLKQATETPIWAYANIQTVSKMFGPMIQQKLQEAKEQLQQGQTDAAGAMMPMMAQGEFMDMYTSLLDSMMQETQFISLSLDANATALDLAFTLAAMPNTEMATLLSPAQGANQELQHLGYLKDGAVMNVAAAPNPDLTKAINVASADLLNVFMDGAFAKEEVAQMKELATKACDAAGGSVAWSFSVDPGSKPPFAVQYAVALKDKQKFYQVLEQVTEMMGDGPLGEFYKKMGLNVTIEMKRNVETYKDVSVDALTVSMDAGESADDAAPQMQMLKNMYGGQWNLRLAVVDKLLLYVLSSQPEKAIHDLIDQAKAGGPGQVPGEVQAAMQLIPNVKQADFFGTYNYLRVLQMVTAMMPMPLPKTNVPSQSNVAFAGDVKDGKFSLRAAVPKQHVQEVIMVFMQMQMQMQNAGSEQGM